MRDNEKKAPPTVFDFPENDHVCMSGPLKEQTEIPKDFPITKCEPSKRGRTGSNAVRPRKRGRPLSWAVAEALAPEANKPYSEQAKSQEVTSVRRISPLEAEILSKIQKLEKENAKLGGK